MADKQQSIESIIFVIDDAMRKLQEIKASLSVKDCPNGHGKIRRTSSGTYWCLLCQRYY